MDSSPTSQQSNNHLPSRRGSTGNLHHSFSVQLSNRRTPSSSSSRSKSRGQSASRSHHGGHHEEYFSSSPLRRISSRRRRSSIGGSASHSMPTQRQNFQRSNSHDFFDMPLPFSPRSSDHDTQHGHGRSKSDRSSYKPSSPSRRSSMTDSEHSHSPDCKRLNDLQDLLCTVPSIFPPSNTKVEEHEYFSKWKVFSEEAFSGSSGDELNELLKRAVRKAKFFLHPDKLPKALTESQTVLFKTMWDAIQEKEANT